MNGMMNAGRTLARSGAVVLGVWVLGACGGAPKQEAAPAPKPVVQPANPAEAAFQKGLAAGQAGNWKEAVGYFETAAKLDPALKAAVVNHGIALERAGEVKEAATVFRAAYEQSPDDPEGS